VHRLWRIGLVLTVGVALPAKGEPFLPQSDQQALERLPFAANDPVIRELRELRGRLKAEPDNLPLALKLARAYLELGRTTGDPRYAGYAEAALGPWWELERPPPDVLLLRAALRQRSHQFDAALADLAGVLQADPRSAQARLMRATVLQVVGDYGAARQECLALRGLTRELVWTVCLASVDGATGRLRESYERLRTALDRGPGAQPEIRAWALTGLAEMAARADLPESANAHFREALALDATDPYLLAAFADFLLDQDRPQEAAALLRDSTRIDPLLLRFALALRALHAPELAARVGELRDRFEASRRRGDRVHLREEARFTLHLLDDPPAALKLATENWRVQKEPADIRILLEAALAARDGAQLDAAKAWLKSAGLEDVQINRILSATIPPN